MTRCSYYSEFDYLHKNGKYGGKYYCQLEAEDQNGRLCYFHSKEHKDQNEFFGRFKVYVEKRIKFGLKIFCIGFDFPDFSYHGNGYVNEPGTWIFTNDVFFSKCSFKKFYLQAVHFKKNAYFDNSKFRGNMELNYCQFEATVSFENVTWNKELFMKVAFGDTVIFHICNFDGNTKFHINSNIPFYNNLTFRECNFNNLTSFSGSNFKGENLFDNCIFNGNVDFNGSYFYKNVLLNHRFTTEFKYCIFNEEVDFVGTYFPIQLEKILAKHTIPKSHTKYKSISRRFDRDNKEELRDFFNRYYQTNFDDNDDIRVNSWRLEINSTKVKFHVFDRVKFKILGINRFKKSFRIEDKKLEGTFIIKNKIDTSITTAGKNYRAKFFYLEKDFGILKDAPINFNYSTFRKRVRFVGNPLNLLSLCAVSFKGVDLSTFEFHNVEWIQKRNLMKHRFILIDELLLKEKGNYDEVSNVYNQLRKNYEAKLLFNESSNFFIGEMESIRQSLWRKNNSVYRLSTVPYFLYKIFALYGESIKLPIIWSVGIIFLIAGLDYFFYDNPNFGSALKDSAFNFLPISWTLPQTSTSGDLYYLEKSFSLIMFGSLFIALRRRFERKK